VSKDTYVKWLVGIALLLLSSAFVFFATRDPVAPEGVQSSDGVAQIPKEALPRALDDREEDSSVLRSPVEAMEVEILRTGSPVSNAVLVLLDPDGTSRSARTDASGRAQFAPREGSGTLLVGRENAFPHRQAIDLTAGAHRVAMPTERVVSGRVSLAGSPPSPPIEIELSTLWGAFADLHLGTEARRALSLDEELRYKSRCATDAAGAFLFEGLPESWCGSLVFPDGYCPIPWGSNETTGLVGLNRPESNLRIELERLPFVTGRVLASDGKTPVARAALEVGITRDEATSYTEHETNASGVFVIPLRQGKVEAVTISADGGAAGYMHGRWPVDHEIRGHLDLGDVGLIRGKELRFRATDREGHPIADAMGQVRSRDLSAITGADGIGVLQGVPSRTSEFFVKAKGFWRVRVPIPEPTQELVEVQLQPCNSLSIALEQENGPLPVGLLLKVCSGKRRVFPELEWPAPPYWGSEQLGAEYFQNDSEGNLTVFDVGANGRAFIEGVTPAIPLTLRVVAPFELEIERSQITPLGTEEHREVNLVLTRPFHSLAGIVLEEQGSPLPGADVELMDGPSEEWGLGSGPLLCRTNDNGRFQFDSIYYTNVSIEVKRGGYVRLPATALQLKENLTGLEFRLLRGMDVAVRVIDTLRQPIESSGIVTARCDSDWWQAERAGPGLFRFTDLPRDTLLFTLDLAGAKYEVEHDAKQPELQFTVPVHGQVEVSWTPPELSEEVRRRYRGRQGGGELLLRRVGRLRTDVQAGVELHDGKYLFPAVLPGAYRAELDLRGPSTPPTMSEVFEVTADQVTRVVIPR
jgi:hypothetical protein